MATRYTDGRKYKGRYQGDAMNFFEGLGEDLRSVLIDSVSVRKHGALFEMRYATVPLSKHGEPLPDAPLVWHREPLRYVPDWYTLNANNN